MLICMYFTLDALIREGFADKPEEGVKGMLLQAKEPPTCLASKHYIFVTLDRHMLEVVLCDSMISNQ